MQIPFLQFVMLASPSTGGRVASVSKGATKLKKAFESWFIGIAMRKASHYIARRASKAEMHPFDAHNNGDGNERRNVSAQSDGGGGPSELQLLPRSWRMMRGRRLRSASFS